jgi:hypothetical protein
MRQSDQFLLFFFWYMKKKKKSKLEIEKLVLKISDLWPFKKYQYIASP